MSLQWTLVATLLYAEMALVLLLVLPLISVRRWQRLFKSRFFQAVSAQSSWYFGLAVVGLCLFFLDAVREMRKYSAMDHKEASHMHIETEMQSHMRLFRAQRNFYISGFALFLMLVVRRLVMLLSSQATLMAENEALFKQAKSADTAARTLLSEQSLGAGEAAQNSYNEAHQKEMNELKKELEEANAELKRSLKDKEALVSQSKSLEKEYDRLSEEHAKLLKSVEGGSNKKAE